MGTTVEVTIEGERDKTPEIARRLFKNLKELEGKFSLYNPESEIVKVNKNAATKKVKVSTEFFELLEKSLVFSELTSGAFDISIAPLVRLWGFKGDNPHFPEREEIRKAIKKCGYSFIHLSFRENEVSFSRPGLEIDMDAIAKGYIVQQGIKFLKKEGINAALINAGGDLYCMGAPSGKEGWVVGIQHPRKKERIIATLTIKDKAVATSGDYENFFVYKGRYMSHIIDPRSGVPSETGVVSATVISPDAAEADALATALIVMGKEKGLGLIDHLGEVEAIVVWLEKGKLRATTSSGLKGKIKFEI